MKTDRPTTTTIDEVMKKCANALRTLPGVYTRIVVETKGPWIQVFVEREPDEGGVYEVKARFKTGES